MLDEGLLDDVERLTDADRAGMLRAVASSGAHLRHSLFLADEAGVERLDDADRPRAVVVLGCGPAALTGDLLGALADPVGRAPVVVLRDPTRLPLWVSVSDVVFAVSHTGVEEGLLVALNEAGRRGAQVVGVGPADTPLEATCARHRAGFLPVVTGWPPALWSLAGPLLRAAGVMGLVSVTRAELDATADLLDTTAERCRLSSESFVNPAKTLALELAETTPVVWGASPVTAVAARRLASQLAARAATAACWGELPGVLAEFGGLLDVPGAGPADLFRDRVEEPEPHRPRLVLLRDRYETPVSAASADRALRAVGEHGLAVSEVRAEGDTAVQQFAYLAVLGDFASVYLGLATGVDQAGPPTGQE